MKFGPDVLLEIVHIVQDGLINAKDVSQALREIEVEQGVDGLAKLTEQYVSTHRSA